MNRGKQWREEVLPLHDVRQRPDLQLRANGLDSRHVRKLLGMLQAGKSLPPVKVARIGRALYLVDGFHRYAAHEAYGAAEIAAEVARMGLEEAREEARLANTAQGKAYGQADKRNVWNSYVESGRHLAAPGLPKSSRVISAELDGMYSHETVRRRLRELGLELNEGPNFKPWGRGETAGDDEDDLEDLAGLEGPAVDTLAVERALAARGHLEAFGDLVHTLNEEDRDGLLVSARSLLETLERGERPQRPGGGLEI